MKTICAQIVILTSLAALSPIPANSQTRATSRRRASVASPSAFPDGVSSRDVHFYSEGIQCYGKVFTPKGLEAESKAAAVVLAPDWGKTAASIERYAAQFASRGLVAMVFDYRGWGKSGGFLQTVGAVKTDDRLRFSQMTTRVRIRRKRLIPQHQILDIRNALYYLQGEPGIDRARVGVWGMGMAGGHVIVVAATDARIKAAVAQAPIIEGRDTPKKASAPTGALLLAEQRIARNGDSMVSTIAANAEMRLALADHHPFWHLEQIPKSTAVLFVIVERDAKVDNDANAVAASKLIKGPTDVLSIRGVDHSDISRGAAFGASAKAAADWFLRYL